MVKPWPVPRVWDGDTVAILASGPSMSIDVANAVRAAGLRAIAINMTFRLAPWADMLYGADALFWQRTPDALQFAGLKVSCQPVPGTHHVHNAGSVGYSEDPAAVMTYGNSGAQAMQIAAKAGARRLLLCGFDMHMRNGRHWHGDYPKEKGLPADQQLRNTVEESYSRWAQLMQQLGAALAKRGVTVINCTPGSALTCFPFQPLEEAIAPRAVPAA